MTRDEFMELVYETFADEPDNVLANGIIEAADAYAEHEKAQLFKEGTTSDLISRQAAIDALNKQIQQCRKALGSLSLSDVDKHAVEVKMASLRAYRGMLENLPPAQPEPQEGHWIRTDCGLDVECKCSKCGYRDFVAPRDEYWFKRNYCPNCGAKMTEDRT